MQDQCFNPYLPSFEYIPDAEPRVFNDRVYIYGSHDKFNGMSFCMLDYVCWSAPISDLSNWRYEGVIFRKSQAEGKKNTLLDFMGAPDVIQGLDGNYYLYFFLGSNHYIGVARCSEPAGTYEYIGKVRYKDGDALGEKGEPFQFDPGIFIDDDGRIYLYTGFGIKAIHSFILTKGQMPTKEGAMVTELEPDMVTIKTPPKYICKTVYNGKDTDFEGHEFFEASSMRKYDGKYYFIYSSNQGHELCYAVSDKPDGDFVYGGTLVSNGDIGIYKQQQNYTGNTHGSLLKLKDKYYVFYHRQTNGNQFSRQACAEEITFKDGKFIQAELTSQGLNGKPLRGKGVYEARIACHLMSKKGAFFYGAIKKPFSKHPYFTQSGEDREYNPDQYIANFQDGCQCVFRYFEFKDTNEISFLLKGKAQGTLLIYANDESNLLGKVDISLKNRQKKKIFTGNLKPYQGKISLIVKFVGKGVLDFHKFKLS